MLIKRQTLWLLKWLRQYWNREGEKEERKSFLSSFYQWTAHEGGAVSPSAPSGPILNQQYNNVVVLGWSQMWKVYSWGIPKELLESRRTQLILFESGKIHRKTLCILSFTSLQKSISTFNVFSLSLHAQKKRKKEIFTAWVTVFRPATLLVFKNMMWKRTAILYIFLLPCKQPSLAWFKTSIFIVQSKLS